MVVLQTLYIYHKSHKYSLLKQKSVQFGTIKELDTAYEFTTFQQTTIIY